MKIYQGQIILAPPSAIKNVWSRKFEDPIICQASGWMSIKQRAKQENGEIHFLDEMGINNTYYLDTIS